MAGLVPAIDVFKLMNERGWPASLAMTNKSGEECMARVAVVTGGTRGIGAAISKALKAAGYKVAASYAGNDEAANKFKAETGIDVYKWDVSSYDACAAGLKQVEADLGPVEVLVNNAGITRDAPFHRMTPEHWNAGDQHEPQFAVQHERPVWEGMRTRKFGRIINISSINGQKGQFGQANYSAAKAGDIGFTKALALEGARAGITVNAICPGYIATEMVHGGAEGRAGEEHPAADPDRPPRRAGRDRALRRVPRLRRCGLHHRLDAVGQRRAGDDLAPAGAFMDALGLSSEELALQARARAFAREVVRPRAAGIDASEEYPWDIVKALTEARFVGMTIPHGLRRAGPLLPRRGAGHRGDGEVLHRHGAHRGRDQHGRGLDRDGLWQRRAEEARRIAGALRRQARDLHHRARSGF